ncbi:MAG: fumarylacetoacetate hydrolase family protein [Gammaproteobacteria bacterium]|nr:fumarylacetoacetate hydrolase family protein [Gammaproteobacteria bacterium]
MNEEYAFAPPARPALPVAGSERLFPVRRVYCVGRNYLEHAREMGLGERVPPFFFAKPADAVAASGAEIPYPPRTASLHHEIELVIALGRGGRDVGIDHALELVFGYAVGNDLTRRDLQSDARQKGHPWDLAKGADQSAPVTPIVPVALCGHPNSGRIWLEVNDVPRQHGDIADMFWSVPEIIAELSTYVALAPGDLIFTGTPAGVGALHPGDRVVGGVEGVGVLEHTIGAG